MRGIMVLCAPERIEMPMASTSSCTRGVDNLLRGLPQAGVDDFHPRIAQGARHNLGPPVVAVQAGFGNQNSNSFVHGHSIPGLSEHCSSNQARSPGAGQALRASQLAADKAPAVGTKNLHFAGLGIEHPNRLGPGSEILLHLLRQVLRQIVGETTSMASAGAP